MTDNAKKIINFLKDNFGSEFTRDEIAEAVGLASPVAVTGTVTSLKKKGFAEYVPYDVDVVMTVNGVSKTTQKTINKIRMTEAGLSYDPAAEEKAKAREKAEKAAARAALAAEKAAEAARAAE